MSITEKLEKENKNQIENIKNEKDIESKMKQISSLILDVGGHCINAVATVCNCCCVLQKKAMKGR